MNKEILQEEKKDILNDILNDKISIKIINNEDNTFQLGFIEKISNKVVYDTYQISYDKNITDLNLATVSLLILKELEPRKLHSGQKISTRKDSYPNHEILSLENAVSYSPENTFYSKNIEAILSKISSDYLPLPKITYEEKNPGVYKFNDGSAIHLKRRVISENDGPLDCGSILFATSKIESLNDFLVSEYSSFGYDREIKKAIENPKTSKLKTTIEFIFGKKENTDEKIISFDTEKIKQLRQKSFNEAPNLKSNTRHL